MASKTLVTAPAKQAVTQSYIVSHLRLNGDETTLLSGYIEAATQFVERRLSRALITQTWDYKIDCFADEIEIPLPPLQSITSIKYIDVDGVEQTLSSTVYDVDTGVEPGVVRLAYNQSWPSIRSQVNAVTIRFVAGYGATEASVPATIRQAVALYVGHLYENREASAPISISTVPMAFECLIEAYRWSFL